MVKVGIISTVKAPLSELRMFVNYHLNIGVDYIVLFFDDPEDEAIEFLSQYTQVVAVKCSSEYWADRTGERPSSIEHRQMANVNYGAKYLSRKQCDWLIHIDSDELVNPLKELKSVLSKCNSEAVRFALLEAVADKLKHTHIFEPTLFKKKPNKIQLLLARIFPCPSAIFDGQYFRGHTRSKMAVRISDKIEKYEIHGAKKRDGKLVVENTKAIELLHYDCVGIDNWKLKWDRRLDGSGKAIDMRANREKQFLLYSKAKADGENQLSLLYKRMHLLPIRERVLLYIIGLLKQGGVDDKLFE